jgi:pyruvate formate lyase activating enzyme
MPSDRNGLIMGDMTVPEEIVRAAQAANCQSISYTYTEPTVFFEFALDTAKLARENGIRNVFVTNGYMTPETLHKLSPYLDAANVDLKAFSDEFYKKFCGARLGPVKETLKLMKSLGILVEITTLLIPGLNDDKTELAQSAAFIADSLGVETPWHISRFHPAYRLTDRGATPVQSLTAAREIGIGAGLRYVYIGNVPGENGEHTFCCNCGKTLIERRGFSIRKNLIKNGQCSYCGTKIEGVRMSEKG